MTIKLGVSFQLPERKVTEDCDYTTFNLRLFMGVAYVHLFFDYTRRSSLFILEKENLSCQCYYGLGPNSGPASLIKRHKYIPIWRKK